MLPEELKQNVTVYGPLFPEPVQVILAVSMGSSVKLIGKGVRSNSVYEPILSAEQLGQLHSSPAQEPFDGDAAKFRLGVEAMRLGLAYEYDPYFSLSIARVDPLPHQLEAVYDYFIKLPRIRFLLADDPGAGKTIMAGLLIKELKIRGLVKRTLIVTPANLSFQWQRELKDKFRESFEVVRSDVLRANYGMNPWQEKNQVITSVSWVSRVDDAKESLMRSNWDLIIVDEAHKMSAYSADKKTLAYQLGESLSQMTDHYLLMTATPHKGDPENFRLFLSLLDKDVYGDIKSLDEAMANQRPAGCFVAGANSQRELVDDVRPPKCFDRPALALGMPSDQPARHHEGDTECVRFDLLKISRRLCADRHASQDAFIIEARIMSQ